MGHANRERMQASDFNAALHEHLRYLQRLRQAAERSAAYEAAALRRSTSGAGGAEEEPPGLPQTDFALKPGETITLKMGLVSGYAFPVACPCACACVRVRVRACVRVCARACVRALACVLVRACMWP